MRAPERLAVSIGVVAAAAVALALLVLPAGCVSFDDLSATGEHSPEATRCGDCHVDVWREWSESPHALAFLSTEFQAATDRGTIESCLPCHVPASMPADPARPVAFRRDHLEEGVHCLACHRVESEHGSAGATTVLAGPLAPDALVQPHAIEDLSAWFRDAALCGRCHEDTYAEWRRAELASRVTCQECHMPVVRRKVTQATDMLSKALVAFEEEHELRAHTFDIASALAEAPKVVSALDDGPRATGGEIFDVEVSLAAGRLEVHIANRLPHAVPTGAFGRHAVELRLLADGEVVAVRTLRGKRGGSLPAGGRVGLSTPWPSTAERLEVVVVSVRRRGEERVESVVLRRDISRGAPASALADVGPR